MELNTDPAGFSVRVHLLGRPSDVFGPEHAVLLPVGAQTVGDVRRILATTGGEAGEAALFGAAIRGGVDGVIVQDSAPVKPGQEVFFFSVVSGG